MNAPMTLAAAAAPMIALTGVAKAFQDLWKLRRVFKDLHLTVQPQESIVLMGPSGSGKSVLLKLVAQLMTPDQGTIVLGSEQVGMLFQKNALFDSLTVRENMLFPLRETRRLVPVHRKKSDRKRPGGGGRGEGKSDEDPPDKDSWYDEEILALAKALPLLQAVGLEHSLDLYPNELSGGMQKRLGIARVLIVEPEIILYDEPTAGLDPITACTIAELILQFRAQQKTTLISVTNEVERAYQLADRIYFLHDGVLQEGGTPAAVAQSDDPWISHFIRGESKS